MPDFAPRSIIPEIEAKSSVIPVPIDDALFVPREGMKTRPDYVHLVWNHRWEYDKGPEVLLHTLRELKVLQCEFRLSLVGQQFSRRPEAFDQIHEEFSEELLHFGFLDSKKEYLAVLKAADCVLSTAHHDFQGLAMMDAIALGCIPFAPNRLAYPEYIPKRNLYNTADDPEIEGRNLAQKIKQYTDAPSHWRQVSIQSHSESTLWPKYHSILGIQSV